jgi:hypothetical protein
LLDVLVAVLSRPRRGLVTHCHLSLLLSLLLLLALLLLLPLPPMRRSPLLSLLLVALLPTLVVWVCVCVAWGVVSV